MKCSKRLSHVPHVTKLHADSRQSNSQTSSHSGTTWIIRPLILWNNGRKALIIPPCCPDIALPPPTLSRNFRFSHSPFAICQNTAKSRAGLRCSNCESRNRRPSVCRPSRLMVSIAGFDHHNGWVDEDEEVNLGPLGRPNPQIKMRSMNQVASLAGNNFHPTSRPVVPPASSADHQGTDLHVDKCVLYSYGGPPQRKRAAILLPRPLSPNASSVALSQAASIRCA